MPHLLALSAECHPTPTGLWSLRPDLEKKPESRNERTPLDPRYWEITICDVLLTLNESLGPMAIEAEIG